MKKPTQNEKYKTKINKGNNKKKEKNRIIIIKIMRGCD